MVEEVLGNIPGIDEASPVPVVDAKQLTEKIFLNDFVNNNQPCLIRGAIQHWPAIEKWHDKQYLINSCGNHLTQLCNHMNYLDEERMESGLIEKKFSDVINILHSSDDSVVSVPSLVIGKQGPFSEIYQDAPWFTFLDSPPCPVGYPDMRAFMYRSAATGWHLHHTDETLMCQVLGTKKVALLPPDTETYKVVYDIFRTEAYLEGPSSFDNVDTSKLKPLVVEVKQGDALYIPPFWWHAVVPVDKLFGITVARCWRSPLHVMGDITFPAVRHMWKSEFKRPSKRFMLVVFLGLTSFLAQFFRKLKIFVVSSRNR